jgi:hypothetical protein
MEEGEAAAITIEFALALSLCFQNGCFFILKIVYFFSLY